MSEGNDVLEFFRQYQEKVNKENPISNLRSLVRDVCLKLKTQGASLEIVMIFAKQVIAQASKEESTAKVSEEYVSMMNQIYLQVYKEEWEKIENETLHYLDNN